MSQPLSPLLFKQGFVDLEAAVKAGKPDAEIRPAFRRLSAVLDETDFGCAAEWIEARRGLGTLRLLWAILPRRAVKKAA